MSDASSPAEELRGRCLCGSVTYRITAPLIFGAICHCTHCQRQTGTLFSMLYGVPGQAFEVEGELSVFHDRGDSGGAVDRKFCSKCGSPIVSVVEAAPDLVFVKAGTLENWQATPPSVETYRDCSAKWVPHFEGAAVFPGSPPAL